MGKRSIIHFALVDPEEQFRAKRTCTSVSLNKNAAALSLLALKQEPTSAASSVGGHSGLKSRCYLETYNGRQGSQSISSSVTDDEEDDISRGMMGSTTLSSLPDKSDNYTSLVNMALTRPHLRLVALSPDQNRAPPAYSFMPLPEGRPLKAPLRLPGGIVLAANAGSLVSKKC